MSVAVPPAAIVAGAIVLASVGAVPPPFRRSLSLALPDAPEAASRTVTVLTSGSVVMPAANATGTLNISAPVQICKWWNAYFNANASYMDNQADYGDGAVVDVQTYNYVIYQQHTFDLPFGLKGEISGYYSGPGVWGGVFLFTRTPTWRPSICTVSVPSGDDAVSTPARPGRMLDSSR